MTRSTYRPVHVVSRAFALGFASGLRSQVALAFLSHSRLASRSRLPAPLRWFGTKLSRRFFTLNLFGEIIVDKLPIAPNRIDAGPLAGRIVLGTFAATISGAGTDITRASHLASPIAGALGAIVGTYTGYHARAAVVARTGVPDPAIAVIEDVCAATIASVAVRS